MSELTITIITVFTLSCMAFNVCRWLYGKTLSETFPAPVVVIIMLTTLVGFFIAFKLLLVEVCNNIFSPDWGYANETGKFNPFSKDIAHILAGIFTIGMSILIYKDEGKIANSKYRDIYKDEEMKRAVNTRVP